MELVKRPIINSPGVTTDCSCILVVSSDLFGSAPGQRCKHTSAAVAEQCHWLFGASWMPSIQRIRSRQHPSERPKQLPVQWKKSTSGKIALFVRLLFYLFIKLALCCSFRRPKCKKENLWWPWNNSWTTRWKCQLCGKSCATTNFICLSNRCRLKCGCH